MSSIKSRRADGPVLAAERPTPDPEIGYQPRDPAVVARNMRAVRSRDNVADRLLRHELWRRGHRYRRYARLPGTPDVVFSGKRVAVFVDGDFWHGRLLTESGQEELRSSFRTPKREWWVSKLTANVARDAQVDAALAALDWTVIRLWERDVKADLMASADRVCDVLHPSSLGVGAESRSHSDSSRPSLDRRSAKRRASRWACCSRSVATHR